MLFRSTSSRKSFIADAALSLHRRSEIECIRFKRAGQQIVKTALEDWSALNESPFVRSV